MTVLLLALLASVPAPGHGAGTAGEEYDLPAANSLYKRGEYAKAAAAYRELLRARPDDPVLRYNLAGAILKEGAAGSLGRAIAEYSRAWRAMPRDAEARHNLDFALKRAGETLVPSGVPAPLFVAYHALSDAELLGLQWIAYWLCLLLATAHLLSPALQPRLRPLLAGALVLWAVFGSWWGLRRLTGPAAPGVVLESSVEARSGPGLNFPVSYNVPEGRRVTVLSVLGEDGKDGEWLEVGTLKEGLKGWVPAKSVERL